MKQLSLFEQPSLNINRDLKEQMAVVVKSSHWSREEILDRMNNLASRFGVHLIKGNGHALKMATFEKWLNPKDRVHVPSINAFVIFCCALENNTPIQVLLAPLGCDLVDEKDLRLLTWAKHYHQAKDARKQMRKIEADL